MDFNITTFIFEIINFLILIWILQRLFYRPLLAVITKRKQFIEQSLTDAKAMQQQAEELRNLYENRQKLWEQEKQAALTALHQKCESERAAQLDKLHNELEQERQKAKVTLTRQQAEIAQQAEKQALQNGARFAAMLLQQAAGPELEVHLCTLLINSLKTLPEACRLCLQLVEHKKSLTIKITSVYLLPIELKQQLEQKLAELIDSPINCQYFQDETLIAGLSIAIGAWILHANVQHELIGFAEIAHDSD